MVRLLSLSALAAFCAPSMAAYVLQDDYSADKFFDMFEFFTAGDPTNGFVSYVDQATAQADGLISTNGNGQITLAVDSTNIAPSGRRSVRLTSNAVYNHGLIILDLAHMPVGCGTWPAFWTVGPNWPAEGEIDIIEGVNDQLTNAMTLHTSNGCGITQNNLFSGNIATPNCFVDAPGQPGNAGCSIDATNQTTYGAGLNAINGGVYATEWTSEAISVYFFPSNAIPSDIKSGRPNPAGWGTPLAMFQGACNIDSFIQNQQIVFDMTFCGDWAGAVWGSSSCAQQSWSCPDFVANNPAAFAEAYWEINSLKVYQDNGNGYVPPDSTTSAGPTGVASNVPSDISSLAPIPLTSSVPITTLVTTTYPVSSAPVTSSTSLDVPGGAFAPASSTSSATPSPSTSSAPAPTSSSTVQYIPATTSSVVPPPAPTTSASVVTSATSTEAPEPYFSTNEPVPASWFEPGGGIPVDQEFGSPLRQVRRGPVNAAANDWETLFHGEKDKHGRHVAFHGKMGNKKHRHFLP